MIAARNRVLAALAAATLPLGALAGAIAVPASAQDSRLVEILYDPANVVRVEGRARVQATIQFDPEERIENVAIGNSNAWQVTPNKRANLLFVKPLVPRGATNMTVVTNLRTYLFDLVASPSNRAVYVVSFIYPAPIVPETLLTPQLANDAELAAANDPFAVVDPAALNFEWERDGSSKLLPDRIYDDGEATYLVWPDGRDVPAILLVDAEGTEGPTNYTVRGDTIIIPQVPSRIVLRSGRQAAGLNYAGPVRVGDTDFAVNEGGSRSNSRRRR